MVDLSLPLFQIPAETWDEAKCVKMARRWAKDGLGTRYPFKGFIGPFVSSVSMGAYGSERYNGGCVRNGQWWQGEHRPLPILPPGFKIVHRPSWGYQIVKTA